MSNTGPGPFIGIRTIAKLLDTLSQSNITQSGIENAKDKMWMLGESERNDGDGTNDVYFAFYDFLDEVLDVQRKVNVWSNIEEAIVRDGTVTKEDFENGEYE